MQILVYSGDMGRKSKFNEKNARRLVDLVNKGLNFKSACSEVGISEDSFARYRKANPDFSKQIKNAKKSFKRANIHREKLLETYIGLPVYRELNDDIPPNKPFYYPQENAIQFFDNQRIRYSCPTDLWSRKHSANLYGDEWVME